VYTSVAESFSRYLSAKKSIDDRSLNFRVYEKLIKEIANFALPLRIAEIGCGLGTMIERLWDWNLTARAAYTAIDRDTGLIQEARVRLENFAQSRQLTFLKTGDSSRVKGEGRDWLVTLKDIDCHNFYQGQALESNFDLVLAHAFMDLIDLPRELPRLLSVLKPGGLYYFTLNFDGGTNFFPVIDQQFEELLIKLYHQSMDDREGGTAGHSQTGRRLLDAVTRLENEVLAVGSSNWIIWPKRSRSYSADEAYFLEYILQTIYLALAGHPDLDQKKFQSWLARRQDQIRDGELIFIAHQLDICGRVL